jgi:DNA-binding NarL/FixJ family response regulator
MSESPIRVLIVDDHAVVRSGLRKVLESEPDIEVVGEAGDAKHAVFETRAQKPDVILMDVVMPGKSGIDATPDVLHDAPEAKVLILSMQDDPNYVREAFAAGAAGYVLKEAADTDVVAAVREVANGGRYVHPTLGARMSPPRLKSASGPRTTRSQTASARYCACSRRVTPTRRSRTSSTSRSAPPKPTAPTSCRSCASPHGHSWCATRWSTACSRLRTTSRAP